MTDSYCRYCDGVWRDDGEYLGKFADIWERYGSSLEEVLKKGPDSKVCNDPECQKKDKGWREKSARGE